MLVPGRPLSSGAISRQPKKMVGCGPGVFDRSVDRGRIYANGRPNWLIFGVYAVLRIHSVSRKRKSLDKKRGDPWSLNCYRSMCATHRFAADLSDIPVGDAVQPLGSYGRICLCRLHVADGPRNVDLSQFVESLPGEQSLSRGVRPVPCSSCPLFTRYAAEQTFRLWGIMTLIALLLTLGQWSPLYVILVKLTRFYAFRFPAKFLGFFVSVLRC